VGAKTGVSRRGGKSRDDQRQHQHIRHRLPGFPPATLFVQMSDMKQKFESDFRLGV